MNPKLGHAVVAIRQLVHKHGLNVSFKWVAGYQNKTAYVLGCVGMKIRLFALCDDDYNHIAEQYITKKSVEVSAKLVGSQQQLVSSQQKLVGNHW